MNYEIMKESEQELQKLFLQFCDHVLATWQYVSKCINREAFSEADVKKLYGFEDESNHLEVKIMDECIWTLSKNQPYANHLRYIIAILNSIKDLERIADLAKNTTKFFIKHKVSKEFRKIILNAVKAAIVVMNKVFKSLHANTALESYQTWQGADNSFRKEYKELLTSISTALKKHSTKEIVDLFQGAILVIKHVERLVDHTGNIAENFMFIKQSNFFFDKQRG